MRRVCVFSCVPQSKCLSSCRRSSDREGHPHTQLEQEVETPVVEEGGREEREREEEKRVIS